MAMLQRVISFYRRRLSYANVLDRLLETHRDERVLLMATPEHGNLGDHAIVQAELEFLETYCPRRKVIEVTGDHFRLQENRVVPAVKTDDVIVITGGGFLGTLWLREEILVRKLLAVFGQNRIVIFPSTMYFEDHTAGRAEFELARRLFRRHKKLTICLRDTASFHVARELLGSERTEDLMLTPDIALYLERGNASLRRDGVLLCFRQDKEKVLSPSDIDRLKRSLEAGDKRISTTSTVVDGPIDTSRRTLELKAKFCEFGSAELVLTDRLHGMIFAVITGTPCIALNNSSGKIKGAYPWIERLPYVRFAESPRDVDGLLPEMLELKRDVYHRSDVLESYSPLIALCREL